MRAYFAVVLVAGCKAEPPPIAAAPDPVQPAIAVVAPKQEQQIRPQQVALTPVAEANDPEAEDLFQQAYMIRDGQPSRAREMFKQVVQRSLPGSPLRTKAEAQLAAMGALDGRDEYLRGYQLKDTDPTQARQFFERVIAATPESDEFHQKAQNQLRKLSAVP